MKRSETCVQRASLTAVVVKGRTSPLPDHPGKNEVMHPVLLVALLAKIGRELRPVPDAVQQRMNKNLSAAGGEFAGRARGKRERAVPVRIIGGDGEAAQVFKAFARKRKQLFTPFSRQGVKF